MDDTTAFFAFALSVAVLICVFAITQRLGLTVAELRKQNKLAEAQNVLLGGIQSQLHNLITKKQA